METPVLVLAVLSVGLAQLVVTVRVWRSDWFSRPQKVALSVLVWLVPVLGAAVAYAALRHDDDVSRPKPNPDMSNSVIDVPPD